MSRKSALVLLLLLGGAPGGAHAQLTPPAGSAGAGNSAISGVPFGPANPSVLSDPSGIGNASRIPPLGTNTPVSPPGRPRTRPFIAVTRGGALRGRVTAHHQPTAGRVQTAPGPPPRPSAGQPLYGDLPGLLGRGARWCWPIWARSMPAIIKRTPGGLDKWKSMELPIPSSRLEISQQRAPSTDNCCRSWVLWLWLTANPRYCVGGRTGFGIHAAAPEFAGQRFRQGSVGLHHHCFRARERGDVDAAMISSSGSAQ